MKFKIHSPWTQTSRDLALSSLQPFRELGSMLPQEDVRAICAKGTQTEDGSFL